MSAYIILPMHGRCGSNLLAANLEPLFRHSDLEMWKPHLIRKARGLGVMEDPLEDPAGYLRSYCERTGLGGGKLFPSDIAMLRSGKWGPDGDWGDGTFDVCKRAVLGVDGVIFMYRRNLTEQFVSLQVASRDGNWAPAKPIAACEPFAIDIDRAIDEIEKSMCLFKKCIGLAEVALRSVGQQYLLVSYEGMMAMPDTTIARARELVGLPYRQGFLKPFVQKRSEQLYRQIIINYDEVNDRMGPRYGVLFGDPGTRWSK